MLRVKLNEVNNILKNWQTLIKIKSVTIHNFILIKMDPWSKTASPHWMEEGQLPFNGCQGSVVKWANFSVIPEYILVIGQASNACLLDCRGSFILAMDLHYLSDCFVE
ncbi:hypothetical protein RIR_jg6529.t1 [Rhizophagus irregularis DAOM 181602=DAOM 197198]|nr:hypothetical protein RIR_jg6529.t1 [Rhizophagus irregularis DAOM 181602=DAOM 197198]